MCSNLVSLLKSDFSSGQANGYGFAWIIPMVWCGVGEEFLLTQINYDINFRRIEAITTEITGDGQKKSEGQSRYRKQKAKKNFHIHKNKKALDDRYGDMHQAVHIVRVLDH